MEKLDAIVLAGDLRHSVQIGGSNKCLLEVGGRPLVSYALAALDQSVTVGEIFVVGPKVKLDKVVAGCDLGKRVTVLEQKKDLVANILCGFEAHRETGGSEYALILSGDMPLITGWELDRFVAQSNYRDKNCVMAFAPEESLKPFRPFGLRLNYLFTKQFTGRINNVFIADIKAINNLHYVGEIYRLRYQKNLINYLRYVWSVLLSNLNKTGLIFYTILPQLCLQLDRLGAGWLARKLARFNDKQVLEHYGGEVFRIRLALHCMDVAFGALDVDSEMELKIYRKHFETFVEIVNRAIEDKTVA